MRIFKSHRGYSRLYQGRGYVFILVSTNSNLRIRENNIADAPAMSARRHSRSIIQKIYIQAILPKELLPL